MNKQTLIDNMVSCYDNGEAMLEYADEYYLNLVFNDLGKLKWLSDDLGWNIAIEAVRRELPSMFKYAKEAKDCSNKNEFIVVTSPSGELSFSTENLKRNTKYRLIVSEVREESE